MPLRAVLTLVFLLCLDRLPTRLLSGQDACPWIGDPGSKTATISVDKQGGACAATNGGFVKASTQYKVHFSATVTGSCQVRSQQCSGIPPVCGCVNGQLYLRSLGSTYLSDPLVSVPPFGSIAPNTNVQSLDTRPPTGTASTGVSWTPTIEGQHTITSSTGWNATPCNLTPTTFSADQSFVANVVACKPLWMVLVNVVLHAPPGDVYIYIPSGMWNQLHGPAEAAANDWNTILNGIVTFHVTQTDCGSGGDCLKVQEDNAFSAGACAGLSPPSNWDHVTGVNQDVRFINLPTSPSWRDWKIRSDDRLKRSIAHELGHALGLNDYESACGIDKALMAPIPGSWPESQKCTSTSGMALAAKPSDILPTLQSTYGNGIRSICGF